MTVFVSSYADVTTLAVSLTLFAAIPLLQCTGMLGKCCFKIYIDIDRRNRSLI